MSATLWVCHDCELIGSETDAQEHEQARGHMVEALTNEETEGVRQIWAEARAKRVVGLGRHLRTSAVPPVGEQRSHALRGIAPPRHVAPSSTRPDPSTEPEGEGNER